MDTNLGTWSSSRSGSNGGKEDSGGTPFVPEKGFYQPSTDDTWDSYQALLSVLEQQLGGYPRAVMCGVADEVLSVLKCENIKNPIDKKAEIEKQLGPIPDYTFDQLVLIGGVINDYYQDRRCCDTDDRVVRFVPEKGFYQPRTEETWTAYKLLIDIVANQLGHEQQIVLCMVAHDVLLILNDEKIVNLVEKKEMIENVLDRISVDTFDMLLFINGLIWDFRDCLEGRVSENVNVNVEKNEFDQNPIRRSVHEEVFEVDNGSDGVDDHAGDDQMKDPTVDDIDFNINLKSDEEVEEMNADPAAEEDKDWVMVDYEV